MSLGSAEGGPKPNFKIEQKVNGYFFIYLELDMYKAWNF